MIAQLFNFVKKSPNEFTGQWGGQAVSDFDPTKNRIELLRFAAILLGDAGKRHATFDEILDCVRMELNANLAAGEREQFLMALEIHPSFKRVSENSFELA
jgi:hypothetical protein